MRPPYMVSREETVQLLSIPKKEPRTKEDLSSRLIIQPSGIPDSWHCPYTRTLMVPEITANMLLAGVVPVRIRISETVQSAWVTMTMITMFGARSFVDSQYHSMTELTIRQKITQQLLL